MGRVKTKGEGREMRVEGKTVNGAGGMTVKWNGCRLADKFSWVSAERFGVEKGGFTVARKGPT